MKRLALVIVAGSSAACIDAGSGDRAGQTLPSDSHYVVVPNGYASPEECIASAPQPFSCVLSLSLCRNGRAGARVGDIVEDGTYTMDGSIAHIVFDRKTMDFDVAAVVELGSPNTTWIVDTEHRWETLQFDNISCQRP